MRSTSEHFFQRIETACILRGRADGNADPLRQLISAHRPHDHAELLKLGENTPAIADFHEDEIRGGRNVFEP